jgi:hypothetical protein
LPHFRAAGCHAEKHEAIESRDCRAKTDHDQRAGNEFDQTGDPEKRHEGRGCPVDAKRYCKYPRARHKK